MNRVIILAGGRGERLRPHTQDCPKPMVQLMGNPILSYQVRWLVSQGCTSITIVCGYLHKVIVDYFEDGSRFNAQINYVIEDKPLGRGGAIRRAMESFPELDKAVLAMNGDIITNFSLSELLASHAETKAQATLVSVPLVSPYGIVDMDESGLISGFREKPELPFWINAGIYVLEPSLVSRLPEVGDHETLTFPELAREGKLHSFRTRALWRAIDTVKDLAELQKECEQLLFGSLFQAKR